MATRRFNIVQLFGWCLAIIILGVLAFSNSGVCPISLPPTTPTFLPDTNPSQIEPSNSVHLEDLTWIEVRDRIALGTKRAIVATGGIEQSGPFVVLNKHDRIVRTVSGRAAKALGDTLVAPIVSFVPEGSISPPDGHMTFPGTLSLRPSTFQGLLVDTIGSLLQHGIKEVFLIGDSGDSQAGMQLAAEEAQRHYGARGRVIFLPQFYNYDSVRQLIKDTGITETPEQFHDELAFSLQLLAIDSEGVRLAQRKKVKLASTGGFPLDSEQAQRLGEKILEFRAAHLKKLILDTNQSEAVKN